ncbi:uncharacterized protein LOC129605522 isoform X2 [Condylostylus longicornis]|nr:uncharacterized protein LOC129605522 isoform X2 [Condylostylus longicornis]XP_055371313.1 uncharacterized protein LOC129605522 isoform X2 [Condylostylus longicornis]
MRIWPPIIYQAIGQICQSILMSPVENCNGIIQPENEHRKVIICATVIVFIALTICGCLYSSAWLTITTTTQVIAVIVYGLFGGIGSSLVMARTHRVLEAVRPRDDKYVRKTIHVCGEAFCQLFLSFVFCSVRTLYGIAQAIFLMASLLINMIPLALLVTRTTEDILKQQREDILARKIAPVAPIAQSLIPTPLSEPRFDTLQPFTQHISKSNPNILDNLDNIELQHFWRSPMARTMSNLQELHYNFMNLDQEDNFMGYINPNGVEIMEIIPEEDENVSSTVRSSTVTIDRRISFEVLHSSKSLNGITINESNQIEDIKVDNLQQERISRFQRFLGVMKAVKQSFCGKILDYCLKPMHRALGVSKLYPTTFLNSTDIFSYVMCLTVLPGIAIRLHNLKFAEIPFLYSLIAFPWMCFSLMTPRFGHSLVKKKIEWHVLGCIAKSLALISISFSQSKLLLSVSSVFLGFGQAISLFLQDFVFKASMRHSEWLDVKYPMCITNGILILIYGGLAHLIVANFGFQASVGLAAGLYTTSVLLWFLILLFDKSSY